MTCIVGIAEGGEVHMGADSCASDRDGLNFVNAEPKIFRRGDFLLGMTHSARFAQVARFEPGCPDAVTEWDPGGSFRHVYDLAEWMRNAFALKGAMVAEDGNQYGCFTLVGFRGRLFVVDTRFSIYEPASGYHAIGSGDQLALGSLATTQALAIEGARARIKLALEAACEHNDACSPDFVFEKIDG